MILEEMESLQVISILFLLKLKINVQRMLIREIGVWGTGSIFYRKT